MIMIDARSWRFSIFIIISGILFLQMLSACAIGQTNYYVSSAGNDTSDGISTSTPWETISKVNSVTFVSGNAIYFRKGDTFYGQINVNKSDVTIGTYGTGLQKPVITGAIQLSGWTVYSGSIYVAQASSLVKNLFANGVQMTLARYPNSGFISITTKIDSTKFTATGVTQQTGYWNGANCRLRTTAWTYESPTVSTQTGTTIVLTSAPHYNTFTTGWGFYLDNKLAALDVAGEWYCDPSNNKVYFYAPGGVNPNTLTVYGSILDYGVNSSQSYITVRDLEFHYQVKGGVFISARSGGYCSILNNTIYGGFGEGIFVSGPSCNINNNYIRNINGNGIQVNHGSNCVISNNTIKNIALAKGYQSWTQGFGILSSGTYATISDNYIDSIGYDGIAASSYDLIQRNIIKNTMLTLCDGSAIYTVHQYVTIQNNIISDVVGNSEGTPLWGTSKATWTDAIGIYIDGGAGGASYCTAKNNTIIRANFNAFLINYGTSNNIIRNNVAYDCASGRGGTFLYVGLDTTLNAGNHTIMKNVFCSISSVRALVQVQGFSNNYHSIGMIDSNYYYIRHGSTTTPFQTLLKKGTWTYTNYLFPAWQSLTGQEANSKHIVSLSYERDTIFVNSTASPMTVSLPPVNFYDLDNNSVVGSFILPPFSSRVLISK